MERGTVIIVLGMHRSGTSCLAGILQHAGVVLGDVVGRTFYNQRGNQEHARIVQLNDAVLARNGGAWDKPPLRVEWDAKLAKIRDMVVSSFAQEPLWGFKDPRTLLTLPFWLQGLGGREVRFVGSLRHPLAVARSLRARQPELSLEAGLLLWSLYNFKLLELLEQSGFPLLDFDLEAGAYARSVDRALLSLGLAEQSVARALDFFDDSLRSQHGEEDSREASGALQKVLPLYDLLREKT